MIEIPSCLFISSNGACESRLVNCVDQALSIGRIHANAARQLLTTDDVTNSHDYYVPANTTVSPHDGTCIAPSCLRKISTSGPSQICTSLPRRLIGTGAVLHMWLLTAAAVILRLLESW